MAERSLSDHPFFSSVAPQEAASDLEGRLTRTAEPLPPEPTRGEIWRDIGRSMAAQGAKGAAGALIGGPGSIETFVAKDIPEALRAGGLYAAERMDMISPEERERLGAKPLPWLSGGTELQQKGYASPLTHSPTYKGVAETLPDVASRAGAPFMAYKSQTLPGKVAGAAAEAVGQNLLGSVAGLPARAAISAAGGAGGEFAALSSDVDNEEVARLAGSLSSSLGTAGAMSVAGKLFGAVRGAALPTSTAERELSQALAEDLRRGHSTMTPQQIAEASARGIPVSVADMAGPETHKILARYAEKTVPASRAANIYNENIKDRAQGIVPRISQRLESVAGMPIDAPALQAAVAQAGQQERNFIYNLVRSTPEAQAIDQQPFAGILNRPVVQDAMRRAEMTAQNDPSLNIVAPTSTAAIAGTPSQWKQTPQGFRQIPGTPSRPAQITPGNLSYWDQVQRELREMGEKAARGGDKLEATSIQNARTQLLKELDNVPGYTAARGRAFETFQSASAPEAGYKFFGNMNAFKRSEVTDTMRQMTPEQRDLFAYGFIHAIDDAAKKSGPQSLIKKFNTDGTFRERAEAALGPDRFASIHGHLMSEDITSKARKIAFLRTEGGLTKSALEGGIAAAAADAAMAGAQISPDIMYKAAFGAAVAATGKLALNATERRIADKILPLAVSQDPADIQRLGELARQSRATSTLLGKISSIMSAAITQYGRGDERPARASGGKVSHDHLVNRLMRLSHAAKKDSNADTEALLDSPDEHIVHALAVAQKAI